MKSVYRDGSDVFEAKSVVEESQKSLKLGKEVRGADKNTLKLTEAAIRVGLPAIPGRERHGELSVTGYVTYVSPLSPVV